MLKGVDSLVARAELLPTRGFSKPYVVLRLYGLALAAPYATNTFLLLRAAGCFGERARCHRHPRLTRAKAGRSSACFALEPRASSLEP